MKTPRFTDTARYPAGYTHSGATDISQTFKRAQKKIDAEKEREANSNVKTLKPKVKP